MNTNKLTKREEATNQKITGSIPRNSGLIALGNLLETPAISTELQSIST